MTAMPVTLSDRAAKRIADILKSEPQPTALRVAVTGGGCSGFQYNFALDEAQLDEDLVVEKNGAKVLIDPVSLGLPGGGGNRFLTDDLIGQALQGQQSQRHRFLRLRHEFHGLGGFFFFPPPPPPPPPPKSPPGTSIPSRRGPRPALAWLKEAKPDVVCSSGNQDNGRRISARALRSVGL